jgi:serine/threonine protein kinase
MSSSRSDPAAVLGSVLVGRYRLDSLVGAGAMAEVFRATDLAEGRVVAVKILRGQTANNREAVARLKREGEVLSALRHKAIVAVEAAHEIEGGVFLVMELLEGETLGARMKRGRMSPAELAPIVAGIVAGLAAAHAQAVVHRDLKPDNIFLVPDVASGREGAIRVKLLDFGISKVWYGEKLTQTGQVLGTPRYMSPEQLGAEVDVDPRIDVYALGVILYEALAGTPPFLATTPTDLIVAILHGKVAPLRSVRPDLSPALEAVVMRAMARHRDARFSTARELADGFLDAAGIEEQFRLAPRKGLETRALGSVRTEDEHSGLIHAQLPPPEEVSGSATRPGTFTELPAFTAPAPPATVMMPMEFDANGLPVAPRVNGPQRQPTQLMVGGAPADAALGLVATALAPPGMAPPGMAPTGMAPTGMAPTGMAPTGMAPTGMAPTGMAPTGMAPTGMGPAGVAGMASTGMAGATAAGMAAAASEAAISGRHSAAPAVVGEVREAARPIPRTSISALPPAPFHATPVTPVMASAAPPVAPMPASSVGTTASLPPPSGAGRFWWVGVLVVGLLAGGLTAGAVIALLHWWRPSEDSAPPPPPLATSAPDAAAPIPDAAVELPDAAVAIPVGRDPRRPERVVTTNRDDDAPDAARASNEDDAPDAGRRRTSGGGGGNGGGGGGGGGGDEPTDPLSLATRALRSGDPTGCVDILDDLIAQGATPIALRRRADCLLRLGERTEAIRDYQRFCRLAPDHPAIGEVREVLEGLGQTCP